MHGADRLANSSRLQLFNIAAWDYWLEYVYLNSRENCSCLHIYKVYLSTRTSLSIL